MRRASFALPHTFRMFFQPSVVRTLAMSRLKTNN